LVLFFFTIHEIQPDPLWDFGTRIVAWIRVKGLRRRQREREASLGAARDRLANEEARGKTKSGENGSLTVRGTGIRDDYIDGWQAEEGGLKSCLYTMQRNGANRSDRERY